MQKRTIRRFGALGLVGVGALLAAAGCDQPKPSKMMEARGQMIQQQQQQQRAAQGHMSTSESGKPVGPGAPGSTAPSGGQ